MSNVKSAPNLVTIVPSANAVISGANEVSVMAVGGVVTIQTSATNSMALPSTKTITFSVKGSSYQDITITCDGSATAYVIWQN